MKSNFKCPMCKKNITVGKHLHASYTCPNCHNGMIISASERSQGHVNYKKNFLKKFYK